MPAPLDNTNAESWTLQRTKEIIYQIEHWCGKDEFIFLGQALDAVGLRPRMWSYLRDKWTNEPQIMIAMEILEQRFLNKMIAGALTRRYHAGFMMFCLKNNHNFTDVIRLESLEQKTETETLPPAPEPLPETVGEVKRQIEKEETIIPAN